MSTDKQAQVKVRPADCDGWLYAGPVVDPNAWASVSAEVAQACVDRKRHDPDGPPVRFEIEIEMMTDAEIDALPEFAGW